MAGNKSSVALTQVTEWSAGQLRRADDYLAAEEPLEIHLSRKVLGVALRTPGNDRELVAGLLFTEGLVEGIAVFGRTGGLRAAGLFDLRGDVAVLREDIGRHNAVDKVIGWALLQERMPLDDSMLLVSGRGGFEIVQKALVAGIPFLASVSAPSSLAAQMAREMGLTLVGFLRGRRFVIYAHKERLGFSAPALAAC